MDMNQVKASVVIITWNRRGEIGETLQALREQDYKNFEVIVVDNNSEDGTAELIEREFPGVRLICLPQNTGIAGRNDGIAAARGEIIVFCDDDVIFERDWIGNAVGRFEAEPRVGLLASKLFNYYDKRLCNWAHPVDASEYADREFDSITFCCGASAARKSVLDEVGYFAEELFAYHEEEDLSTRIIDAGYRILYCPELVAYHKIPTGEPLRMGKLRMYYGTRNGIWFFWKYYPLRMALMATLLKIPFELGGYAFKRRDLGTYLRACFAAIWGLPGILRIRQPVSRETLERVTGPRMRMLLRL